MIRVPLGKALQAEGCVTQIKAACSLCENVGLRVSRAQEDQLARHRADCRPSLQVLLQVLIIITGNYNFFNLLTLVLTTSLLDDRHLSAEPGLRCHKKMPTCECHPVMTTKRMSSA